MDYQARLKDHFQTGMEEGIRQGREEGIQEKANEVAIKLLKKGLDPELIAESTGLPVDAVRSLKNSF